MILHLEDMPKELKGMEATFEKAAVLCLDKQHVEHAHGEVDVTFVSAEQIAELNGTHRDKPEVTDVLSFPQYEDPSDIDTEHPYLLGDVVICLDRAKEQAEEYGHSLQREVVYLFVHSVHHLLGFDHEEPEDKEAMRAAEEAVMEELGIVR